MGKSLVGAMRGNTRGHFEDTGLVELHDSILRDNGCHMYSPTDALRISERRISEAREILEDKANSSKFVGWKDPRTSLFLEFWAEQVPDCKFVFLFRNPFSVIDSLRRRGTDRRIKIFPWLPATAWLRYNRAILEFRNKHSDRSLLVNIDSFNSNHKYAKRIVGDFLKYDLKLPYTTVYREKELAKFPSKSHNIIYSALDSLFKYSLTNLYGELEEKAAIGEKMTNWESVKDD